MAVTSDEFKSALRRFASGITVITARADGQDHGMTASAFSSLSLNPPQILVCVARSAAMHAVLMDAGAFGVTLLADTQQPLSDRFAGRFPKDQDRFADLEISRGPDSGAAWLPGGLAWLDCRVARALDGGDHTIFVGEVTAARSNDALEPHTALLYLAGRYRTVGDAL